MVKPLMISFSDLTTLPTVIFILFYFILNMLSIVTTTVDAMIVNDTSLTILLLKKANVSSYLNDYQYLSLSLYVKSIS